MISAILHAPAGLCSPQKSAEKNTEKYEIKGIALGINSAVATKCYANLVRRTGACRLA